MKNQDLSLLQPYCENNMRRLKRMSQSIFMRFNEPLSYSDYDDFYSLANLVLWQAYNSYDPDKGVCFEGFLHTCLQKKFKTELTNRHRHKRVVNQFTVSLDAVNENDEECSLLDYLSSNFDTFEEVLSRQDKMQYQDKVERYLSKLSTQQINILNLAVDGYEPNAIRRILEMSEREYSENMQNIKAYENVKILF